MCGGTICRASVMFLSSNSLNNKYVNLSSENLNIVVAFYHMTSLDSIVI